MMTVSPSRAKSFARSLRREYRQIRSWRKVAKLHNNHLIKAGTLNRIAKSNGEWIPKDQGILLALGLIKPRKPRKPAKKLHEMNHNELLALRERLNERLNNVNDALDKR